MAHQSRASSKSIKLLITCVKGEGKYLKFWAVPEQSRKIFDDIGRFLEEESAKFETLSSYMRSSQLQCGSNVCVKSESKARWCRARVESSPTQYSVTVTLLDYGQEETVSVSDVRAFDERLFTEHPPLAVECILGDVVPMSNLEWPPKAVKFCEQHILHQTVCGFVITKVKDIPVVRLAKLGQNEPFVQLLINQGLANIEQYEPAAAPPKGAASYSYRSLSLGVNVPHLVKISYVDSPERFFVQLSAAELELNNLMDSIDKHVSGERLAPLETPSVNTPCLSPFNSAGSCWRYYRTLITAVESRTCKVFFVDYGYTDTRECGELKAMPANFLQLPAQAFKCSLPAAANVTKEALVSATSGKHLYCHILNIKRSSYVVKLSLDNSSDLFAPSDPGFSFYNIMHLSIHSREEVLVSYVCGSCEFFCQLERNDVLVKNIRSQLNADDSLQPAKFGDCIPGAPVCVRYSEDGVWYRAKVLHAENPDSVKVIFVDYGNSETAALRAIRRLSPELAKIPMQALKCTLSGLENVADPANGARLLEELIEDRKLAVEILSSSRETGYVVNLYDASDPSVTLNAKIKQHVLGAQQQQHKTTRTTAAAPEAQNGRPKLQQAEAASVPQPSVERVEKLYISSFTSESSFFGQLNRIDETKLDEMQGEINELYSAAGRGKSVPSVGDVVCARFSEDDNFYRARVEQCVGDLCRVFFVDYGNRETVGLADVHKIRQKFTVLPQFGVECALQSSTSAESVQQLKDIMEENVYEFNMLSQQNGKWIVSLTEDYVSNAPVLEFLRQHEAPVRFNQGTKGKEGSETDAWGESSEMNDQWQHRGDGGGRKDPQRSYGNSEKRQRNPPSRNFNNDNIDGASYRNYGERTVGPTRNFGDRTSTALKNFGGRADGPKKNFGDRTDCPAPNFSSRIEASKKSFGDRNDGPPKHFGDRTPIPRKGFADNPSNTTRNSENSSWEDKSQNFGSKSDHSSDNSSTKSTSFQVNETSRTIPQNPTEPPKLTDYSKVNINNGTYLEVYVSHIVSPGEFYCQATEEKLKMPAMMEKISRKYSGINDNELRLADTSVGRPCCAIYSEDGCWYRGKIIGVDHSSRLPAYDVFFVDYGNVERVPSPKVKSLDPEFFGWPPQALKCALFNIVPHGGSWSRDDVKTFMDMALDKCFVAKFEQVDSAGTYLVNLLNINKLQDDIINKDLTIAGHGRLADANKLLVINSQIASTNLSFAEPEIREGTTEEVIVTWVSSPMEFYCQLDSFQSVFMKMMKDLQSHYNKTTDTDHVDRPQPGMICVAQFSEDNAWYRAKVVSVEKNYVAVYYVDYGNSEQVPKKKVKYIHQDFTVHAVQGIRCRLGGVKLSGESCISKSVGERYFGGKTVCTFLKKADGFFYVTLLNDSKNVAEELLHGDVVLPDSQSAPLGAPAVSVPEVSASVKVCIPSKQLDMSPGMLLTVIVPYIDSPKQFWCSLVDNADQLEELMDSMDAHYSSSDTNRPLADINVGCGCVAQYSEDQRWYRAVVKDLSGEMDSCEVFFVDFGNSEVVKASEVKIIEPEFCALPAQAIKCRLHGIPETISSEETAEFMKILESEELLAKVEFVDGDVLVVTLLDSSGEDEINVGESIFGSLPKHTSDVEYEVPTFSKPTIRIGTHNGYISYVNDPSDFYVQLEETEEELSEYAADLSEQYECIPQDDFVVQDACVGMACCAKFTDDNQWYRAEIIDITDSSATVLFVDYGNTDVVQVPSLKTLTEHLLKKPPYAIHCTLAAVKPVTGDTWSAEAITVFEQSTSDTLLTVKIESHEMPVPVILTKEEEDVAKQLADLQLCCYDGKAEDRETNNTSELISHCLDARANGDVAAVDFKPCNYPERACDVVCRVKLSYAYSLDKFYVTPIDTLEQLDSVTEKLQELYNSDEESGTPSFVAAIGRPCVARYNEDMAWYRALITDIRDDVITVLFVDFGNSEVTTSSCLRPLRSELLEIPPVAVECCLFGVKLIPGGHDKIGEKLNRFVESEAEFEMEIVEGRQPCKVKLKGGRDLVEELVDEGLVEYIYVEPAVADSGHFEVTSTPADVLEKEQGPVETALEEDDAVVFTAEKDQGLVLAGSTGDRAPTPQISVQKISVGKLVVDVKHVEVSNNLIVLYVVPTDQNDALTDLQHRINENYEHDEKRLPRFSSSRYCVAKSSEDDCWYRAEVLHSDGGSYYYVKYIDFGNCERVASENVAELLPEFSSDHRFSVSCCLFGVRVVEGSEDDAVAKILDVVGESSCTLRVNCDLPGTSVMCSGFLIDGNGSDVTHVLVEEGLVCHLCPPVKPPGDEFDAEINSVQTDDDLLLCVIPTSWIKERERFRDNLQEACNGTEEDTFDFRSDLLCAVLFHDEWSRGYVICSSRDEVAVYLIDFGIVRTVCRQTLKPLPSEFCESEPLILRCALHNRRFPLTDTIRDKFYETCMAKTARCKIRDNLVGLEPFYVSVDVEGSDVLSTMMQFSEESGIERPQGFERMEEADSDECSSPDNSKEPVAGDFEEIANEDEYSSLDNFKEPGAGTFREDADYSNEDEHFEDAQTQIEFEASVGGLGHQSQPCVTFTENIEDVGTEKYPERTVANKCAVKLSCVYSSDKFFVVPVELQEQFTYITSVVKEQYDLTCESDEQPLRTPHITQPCVAQHAERMAWYRAAITDVKDDEVSVLFVDLGSVATVKRSGLRMISPELLKIAPVAIECSLFGIRIMPGKQDQVNSRLTSMSESELELEMEVAESHELPYKIKLRSDVDISEQLVQEGLCEFYVTPSQKLQDSETFKENLRIAFLEEPLSLEDNKGIIPQQNISPGRVSVSIKCVAVSGDTVVLHVVPDSLKGALASLQEKLQATYRNSTCSSLQTGSKFCAAKSSDDGSWYRAQLLDEAADGCNVKYVDYGNCETVPFPDLRVLLPEFIGEVQCSFACRLSGVRVIPGKERSIEEKIYDVVSETETAVEIYEVASSASGMCRAALKVDIDSSDISHILMEDGLVSQAYPAPRLPGASFQARVEEIKSGDRLLFYVIPTDWIEARNVCQKELLEAYECPEPAAPCSISDGSLYAAVFDKQWYRASVVSVSADLVAVNLVDYGKCENADKEWLRYLESEFCHSPPFVLQCTLCGCTTPVSDTLCEKFSGICRGKTVSCKLMDPSSCEPFAVSVEVDGEDILPTLLAGRSNASEGEFASITNFRVDDGTVYEYDPQCCNEGIESESSKDETNSLTECNESVLRVRNSTAPDNFEGQPDVECESAGAGETVLSVGSDRFVSAENDDVTERDLRVDPREDLTKSRETDSAVGSPQEQQTSKLTDDFCDVMNFANTRATGAEGTTSATENNSRRSSAFSESASPAAQLTTRNEDSSVCVVPVTEKNLCGDRLFQNSFVAQAARSSEMEIKLLTGSSVSSPPLEEPKRRNSVEGGSFSSPVRTDHAENSGSVRSPTATFKSAEELNSVVADSCEEEQCTSNEAELLSSGGENDDRDVSVSPDRSVSSDSNVENVPKMQVNSSENTDRTCAKS